MLYAMRFKSIYQHALNLRTTFDVTPVVVPNTIKAD